ncbi:PEPTIDOGLYCAN-BINDING LYSM DOMAIN-CONTAINING PROTEIN [Salix viminalis]|nr:PEPTIDOGLYCAN-BINDING LYSM DOMAIN-CONTAINING PROTEIN [Salix viminalis]
MSSLQGYYGLKLKDQKNTPEGFELAVNGNDHSYNLEGGLYLKPSPASHPPLCLHRKTRSLVNELLENKTLFLDEAKEIESGKLVRCRQKSETDFTSINSELLIREENSGSAFSIITGKCLALRPKAGNRATKIVEAAGMISAQSGPRDVADGFLTVRKSSSTPSLHDQDSISSSIWPASKWSLKPDLQALSASTITRPIFDGLPKPITGRKNKTALD